jgi:2-phospho-L-lactate transferase/gluconeogenesis factor (CofD/UPF0052 family)
VRIVTLNLEAQPGETDGYSPVNHLEVLAAHAPGFKLDVVLADRRVAPDTDALRETATTFGADLVVADVAMGDGSARHDPERLARAYADIIGRG